MRIAVLSNNEQWEELQNNCDYSNMFRIIDLNEIRGSVDGYIILSNLKAASLNIIDKPVLVNSVIQTLSEMKAPVNIVRINGWNSFLQAKKWEAAGKSGPVIDELVTILGKQLVTVKDEVGFVSPRIIAMIINEAYFALSENISTKNEIDIAMRSGTNYPYGPFEWANIIGVNNVYTLLEKLATNNKRYTPAPLLKYEASL